jgi:hypothetical protein
MAVKIFENGDPAITFMPGLFAETNALRFHGSMVAGEILRLQK